MRSRRDRGAATLEYVALLLVMGMLVSLTGVSYAASTERVECLVRSAIQQLTSGDDPGDCPDSAEPGNPGEGDTTDDPPPPCQVDGEVRTRTWGTLAGASSTEVLIGCDWVDVPPQCEDLLGGDDAAAVAACVGPTPVDDPACAEGTTVDAGQQFVGVDCRWVLVSPECLTVDVLDPDALVTAGSAGLAQCMADSTGPPSTDQDDPSCADAPPHPTAGPDPTAVQVGCRSYVVPEQCADALGAFRAVDPVAVASARAGMALADCVTDWYERAETPCVVSTDLSVSRTEIKALFFIRTTTEQGMLVEELGDGKVRVHLLDGGELGGGVDSPDGTGPSFEAAYLSGYKNDTTHEFATTQDAQAWIDWYASRQAMETRPGDWSGRWWMGAPAHRLATLGDEPPRREHSVASSRTTTIKGQVTLDSANLGPGGQGADGDGPDGRGSDGRGRGGRANPTGGVATELSLEQEVEVEDRVLRGGVPSVVGETPPVDVEGWRVQTYKVKDTAAALLLLQLGGEAGRNSAQLTTALAGEEVTGTLSVTQVRRADGSLDRLVVTADSMLLTTLSKQGVDVSVILPKGFSASFSSSEHEQAGTIATVQTVLPTERLNPADAVLATQLADGIFPRNDDGTLRKGDVDLGDNFGRLGPLVNDNGTARSATYDVDRTTTTDAAGLNLVGLPLIEVTSLTIEEGSEQTSSQLTVVDVTGATREVTPAPACDLPSVDPATYPYDPLGTRWENPHD